MRGVYVLEAALLTPAFTESLNQNGYSIAYKHRRTCRRQWLSFPYSGRGEGLLY